MVFAFPKNIFDWVQLLQIEVARCLSFPDAPVANFLLNESNKVASFISDAFVGTVPSGKWFDDSTVFIIFEKVQITEEGTKVILSYSSEFALREICEFILEKNSIILRVLLSDQGFGRSLFFQTQLSRLAIVMAK